MANTIKSTMARIKITPKRAELIAKVVLQEAIGCAYYKLENENYTQEEVELICRYINKYGEMACKAFGKKYVTY